MTFLEFAVRRLLGEPTGGTRRDPYWDCPACGRAKLHIRPPLPAYKDRVACWVCDYHEDAAGLWKSTRGGYYRDAVAALDAWRGEWEQAEAAPPVDPSLTISSGGSGGRRRCQDHPLAVAAAWADLSEDERETLISALEVMDTIGRQHPDVSLGALAQYCRDFVESMRRMEEHHLRTCDDPECDAPVCRAVRSRRKGSTEPVARFRFGTVSEEPSCQ